MSLSEWATVVKELGVTAAAVIALCVVSVYLVKQVNGGKKTSDDRMGPALDRLGDISERQERILERVESQQGETCREIGRLRGVVDTMKEVSDRNMAELLSRVRVNNGARQGAGKG